MPTLRQLLALPPDPTLDGQSFAPALHGDALTGFRRHHFTLSGGRPSYHTHAVSTGRHKLIYEPDGRWIYFDVGIEFVGRLWYGWSTTNSYRYRVLQRELYDIVADPHETRNLVGTNSAVESDLETRLRDWIDRVYADRPRPRSQEHSPETIELMRSLGYVQ